MTYLVRIHNKVSIHASLVNIFHGTQQWELLQLFFTLGNDLSKTISVVRTHLHISTRADISFHQKAMTAADLTTFSAIDTVESRLRAHDACASSDRHIFYASDTASLIFLLAFATKRDEILLDGHTIILWKYIQELGHIVLLRCTNS